MMKEREDVGWTWLGQRRDGISLALDCKSTCVVQLHAVLSGEGVINAS